MSNELERGLEKQKQRYHLLRELYQRVGSAECSTEDYLALAAAYLGLDLEGAEEVLLYLEGESLLERLGQGQIIVITGKGMEEIERSLFQPDESTEHFSAPIIQSSQGARATQPDLGTANTSHPGPGQMELLQLLDTLQETISALPPQQRQEAYEYLEDLKAEVSTADPKNSKLKATLMALWYTGEAFVPFTTQVCELAQELGIHLPTAVSRSS